ncbi:MAG: nuclear transport factor 2 family protein [Blastocatellia bacterium]
MKIGKLLLSLMMLAGLAAGALAQVSPVSDDHAADREAIRAHIDSIFQAYIKKDRERVLATHSEDWRGFLIGSRSVIRGIDEYMKTADQSLRVPNEGISGYKLTELDVVFQGDIAVVNYVADTEIKSRERAITSKLRVLDVYAKRNGHWIQIASNTATHPDAAARAMSEPALISAQARQWILQSREEVWRAWFANDREKLDKLIPEDAIAINAGDSPWETREAILAGAQKFAQSGAKLVRLEFPRTEMQVYGNTVILYTTYRFETEANGKRETSSGRATEMFVVRNNTLVNTGWHLDSGK